MLSRFTWPVLVASAFHAGLFCLTWETKLQSAPPKKDPERRVVFMVPREPPEEIEVASSEVMKPKGKPTAERPGLDEFLAKEPAVFEMPARAPRPPAPIDVPRMGWEEWGDPRGAEDLSGRVPVLSVGVLDNPPRTRVRVAPVYPADARVAEIAGEVWVEFVVDESGRVTQPRVMRSTDERFEAATLRAVEKWRFEPGTKNGRPVRFRMAVPVVFSLEA